MTAKTPVGYALAMRVLQSDLYAKLDDEERGECDALVRGAQGEAPAPKETESSSDDLLARFDAAENKPDYVDSLTRRDLERLAYALGARHLEQRGGK